MCITPHIKGIFKLLSRLCLLMILTQLESACFPEFSFVVSRKYLDCSMKFWMDFLSLISILDLFWVYKPIPMIIRKQA